MQQAKQVSEPARSNKPLPMSMRVANAMHKIGVVGLPRNYEVFYGAISGTSPEIQKELMEIGNNIDQEKLDNLFATYCARADDDAMVSKICNAVENKLTSTIEMIKNEQSSVSQYGKILGQATQKLDPGTRMSPDVVNRLVGLLMDATETTQKQGQKTLEEIEDNSSELRAIKSELAEYKKQAETDALTGLYNRRAFDNRLGSVSGSSFGQSGLIIGDIDRFKTLNDTYGHPFGDLVIKNIAKVMQSNSRGDVLLARLGGEEFAIFSTDINEEGMMRLAERVRVAVAEESFGDGRIKLGPGKVTISMGVCHASSADNVQGLYSQADEALYASKRNGRNRVTSYDDLSTSPERKNLYLYQN
ncbi:MAG: GGDEF domain-containing protein [Rhizobiaceae bacterium]